VPANGVASVTPPLVADCPRILPELDLPEGLFSFGNGSQAIDIIRAHFEHFFQMRLEIIE
jgi:hypothetical protein